MSHAPVMLAEMLAALDPRDGERIVDATFGGGGYSQAILQSAACQLIAIDRDPAAIGRAAPLQAAFPQRFSIQEGRFGDLANLLPAKAALHGAVFDIGVSSFQLDEAERGFSFRFEAPLDMRMGSHGKTAADAVNALPEAALADVIYHYGEEPAARRIARAILQARPLATTKQLADLIEQAVGGRRGAKLHPATKTFQALRILVNDELGELASGLVAAEAALAPGGRLVVVSFHSLEDRMVKDFFDSRSGKTAAASRYAPQPARAAPAPSFTLPTRKAITPSPAELAANPRARSGKLRLAVRTSAPAQSATPSRLLPPDAWAAWEALP